jgi:cell wall-associated NlpC family hydrolase
MPAHRSALSQRAPRASAGGRHRSEPAPRPERSRPLGSRSLGGRAAVFGATGATTAAVLGLGVGLAAPLDAGAAVRPATPVAPATAVQHPAAVHQPGAVHHPAAVHQPGAVHHRSGTRVGIVKSPVSPVLAPARVTHPVRKAKVQPSTLGVRAVRLAATRAGDPYVWGAEGPRAFDCSGLVQWVFDHLHRDLPRTAGAQYDATRHISHSQARAGDLIFFASGGQIYHVAIYAGHGWIWAAPYPGKDVEKEKLWTNDFLVGRVR